MVGRIWQIRRLCSCALSFRFWIKQATRHEIIETCEIWWCRFGNWIFRCAV